MNGHFCRDPDLISRLPGTTTQALSVFIGFRCSSTFKIGVLDQNIGFIWLFIEKLKKTSIFFLLRGSFYIILGIQNQFSGIQNSKFYEILHNLFLIKKSIFIYKNRFLDLKRVSFRPNANTTISGKKGLPTLFARPYIKSWLYWSPTRTGPHQFLIMPALRIRFLV